MKALVLLTFVLTACSPQGFEVQAEYLFVPRWVIPVTVLGLLIWSLFVRRKRK